MRLQASSQDVTRVESEIFVAPLFEGRRPPRGLAGRVDWYLGGFVSRLIREGRISGAAGERTLVAVQRKLSTPRLLLVGAGRRRSLGAGESAAHLRSVAAAVRDLRLSSVAIELPSMTDGVLEDDTAGGELLSILRSFFPDGDAAPADLQVLTASEEESRWWRRLSRIAGFS